MSFSLKIHFWRKIFLSFLKPFLGIEKGGEKSSVRLEKVWVNSGYTAECQRKSLFSRQVLGRLILPTAEWRYYVLMRVWCNQRFVSTTQLNRPQLAVYDYCLAGADKRDRCHCCFICANLFADFFGTQKTFSSRKRTDPFHLVFLSDGQLVRIIRNPLSSLVTRSSHFPIREWGLEDSSSIAWVEHFIS